MALLAGHRSPYTTDLLPSVASTAGTSSASALHMEYLQAMDSESALIPHTGLSTWTHTSPFLSLVGVSYSADLGSHSLGSPEYIIMF